MWQQASTTFDAWGGHAGVLWSPPELAEDLERIRPDVTLPLLFGLVGGNRHEALLEVFSRSFSSNSGSLRAPRRNDGAPTSKGPSKRAKLLDTTDPFSLLFL